VLACTYLAIQYMLALKRSWFLLAIGAIAIAEPVLLLQASRRPAGFAVVVLAIQAAGAFVAFVLALRQRETGSQARTPTSPSEPDREDVGRLPALELMPPR
jgi:hypothetical protein